MKSTKRTEYMIMLRVPAALPTAAAAAPLRAKDGITDEIHRHILPSSIDETNSSQKNYSYYT